MLFSIFSTLRALGWTMVCRGFTFALLSCCVAEPQLAFEASGHDHFRGGSFLRTVACLRSFGSAHHTVPCCLHVVVQLTGRFIIDAGALNKELMLQHPELQFYFSDLSRPLPEASVVATSELFRMIAVGKVQKSS